MALMFSAVMLVPKQADMLLLACFSRLATTFLNFSIFTKAKFHSDLQLKYDVTSASSQKNNSHCGLAAEGQFPTHSLCNVDWPLDFLMMLLVVCVQIHLRQFHGTRYAAISPAMVSAEELEVQESHLNSNQDSDDDQ